MNSFKKLQKVICLIVSLLMLASLLGGCQNSKKESSAPESSSSESSSSSEEESDSTKKVPMGDFAVKYKDSEMSLDEYSYIVTLYIRQIPQTMEHQMKNLNMDLEKFVRSGSFEGKSATEWVKEKAIKAAKMFLNVREDLKTLGKDLSPERKKALNDQIDKEFTDEKIKNLGVTRKGVKEFDEDGERKQMYMEEHSRKDPFEENVEEAIVNDEVINKVDIVARAKLLSDASKNQKS